MAMKEQPKLSSLGAKTNWSAAPPMVDFWKSQRHSSKSRMFSTGTCNCLDSNSSKIGWCLFEVGLAAASFNDVLMMGSNCVSLLKEKDSRESAKWMQRFDTLRIGFSVR